MTYGEAQQLYDRSGGVHRDGLGREGVEGGGAAEAGEEGEVDGVGEETDGGEGEDFVAAGAGAGGSGAGGLRAAPSGRARARAYQLATAMPYIASHTTPMTASARSRRTTSSGSPAVPRSANTA